jgi:hypothetical protein
MCVVEERGEDVGYKSTSVANDVALAVSFARFFFRQSHSDTEKGGGEEETSGLPFEKEVISLPCAPPISYSVGFFSLFLFYFLFWIRPC